MLESLQVSYKHVMCLTINAYTAYLAGGGDANCLCIRLKFLPNWVGIKMCEISHTGICINTYMSHVYAWISWYIRKLWSNPIYNAYSNETPFKYLIRTLGSVWDLRSCSFCLFRWCGPYRIWENMINSNAPLLLFYFYFK